MKNFNLIKRLFMDSHEKQSPQRFGRYAAMLIMLLTLGVGQMWGAKERYIYCGISEHYDNNKTWDQFGFNFWGGTSGGVKSATYIQDDYHDGRNYKVYRVQVYDNNNKAQFKGNNDWYVPGDGYSVTLNGTTNNAVYWSASENGWYGQFQKSFIVSSSGSLSASSTSVAIRTNVTLTPSLSSNSTYNEIKSTSYVVTTNPNSGGSMASNVFSATKAGTYVVTATITYNAKDFSGITQTVDATVTITVYATVTFDKEGGSDGTSSQNATYGSATSSITAPSKSYYDFAGYWTGDDGTGTEVINSSGAWKRNIANFTNNDATWKWIILTDQTLHAKWTPKNYSITYKDQGDVSYSGSNGASLPTSYTYGTGIASLTDGVKSGYRFDGWYTSSDCSTGLTTSISSSATGNKTFYAKWTENPGGTVTLTAGAGGQVSKNGSSWGASTSYTGIKTTDALNIYAQANDGYVFSSWTRTSGTGTIANTGLASTTYTPVANADAELTANFSAKTNALSVSSSTLYAGDNITLTATRTNHSLNLTYQYKIGSGAWTDIATQSGTTKTWQIPYANTYQTYKFRVKSTDGSVDIISSEQTVTVKGRIIIHVKNTNSWASMYLYSWYYDGSDHITNGAWPGSTGSGSNGQSCTIHATGSQWWDVTITQETATAQKFILNCNTSGDQNQTGNLNLSDFTHDAYYAMSTNGSANQTLSTTTTPAAPTLSTSAASSIAATSATLGGNVTNLGNDIISERGYYWSTNSTLSSSNLGVGTKVTVSGTQSSTGTFSNSKTGLTNGTTYYFIAYAKNGYGTSYGVVNNFRTKFITTVTLNMQGGSDGTSSVSATEGSAMPSGKTAPGKTGYTFGGYYASAGGSGKKYYNANMTSANNWDVAASTATIHAEWTAKTYDVTLNVNGGSGANQTVTATYDAAMPTTLKGGGAIAARTRTGYNFAGYAQNANGTGTLYYTSALASNNNWNQDVVSPVIYAKWTPKQSALTFDYQTSATGYGSSGSISAVSATYDAEMPTLSGSMPTAANGYAFMGFYDATGGGGTQYYDGTGASVTNWDKDKTTGTTLYAYYKKAEITALTLDAATVAPEGKVVVTPTIEPTPTEPTKICWEVRYSNDNPLAEQPEMSWSAGKLTFNAPVASGTYKIVATLKTGSDCAGGTELSTASANFQVAGSHTVTVQYKDASGTVIAASTTITGKPLEWSSDITAPTIFGYTFARWDAGDGVTIKNGDSDPVTTSTDETIKIKATYDGRLTAVYNQKSIIYFKNTLNWPTVRVHFLPSDYWTTDKGSGNNGKSNCNLAMTQLGETDIWYYDYGATSITPSKYIAFTQESMSGYENFYADPYAHVVYPTRSSDALTTDKANGLGFYAKTPMFVPYPLAEADGKSQNSGKAKYYNDGYWTKYTSGTGYTLEIYYSDGSTLRAAIPFTSADELMPMKAVADLEAGQTYKFRLKRDGDVTYENTGTMTYANHGQGIAWEYNYGTGKTTFTSTAAGDYTFNLSYSANASQYRLRMSLEYPIASGDYRVIYDDAIQTNFKASNIITKQNNTKDTVSFFVRPGNTPVMKIQQSSIDPSSGAVTWNDYSTISSYVDNAGGNALSKDSVYNICLIMNESGAISVENVEAYTGNYYIRTDAANSKWSNYRSDPDHLMTYSEYSINHGGYSHYYCHWVQTGDRQNVKFCIANDYSPSISDTLTRETATGTWANIATYINEGGDLLRNANVRFMWNRHDNTISRAYVDGAQEEGTEFLLMINTDDPNKIRWSEESALSSNKVTFSDKENWIYEANIQAQPNAQIKLMSTWGTGTTIVQYFKGAADKTETLVGGSGTDWYDIRVLYDFKTNRIVAAYVPATGTINSNVEINADIMFIREHQGDIAQLTFGGSGAISKITTAYGVVRFNKYTLNNKSKTGGHSPLDPLLSRYERDLYYISFPFRVNLEEVFGFGTYGTHWIIEEYDGAARAANGFWADTPTFWRYITNRKGKFLEPNKGYILALDLDMLGESSDVWGPASRSEQIELYFPSFGTMPTITNSTVTYDVPEHTCTIGPRPGMKDDRRVKDSHWNIISVPTYVNTDDFSYVSNAWTTAHPNFLYEWNSSDNTLTARSTTGYTFKAMHAYTVQYHGSVTWSTSVSPASIVARRTYEEAPNEVEFRIELSQNEQMIDQTFVRMSNDEEVSAGFAFGEDLSKEFNRNKANIYTMVSTNIDGDLSTTETAGNCLPMSEQTTIVPMGIQIAKAGEYTISIPSGTNGVGVTLIDNETGLRTNLALEDYRVELDAATYDSRFIIEISPIVNVLTNVEQTAVSDQPSDVRKVIIDQKMYIIKDGKVYDAQGARVK